MKKWMYVIAPLVMLGGFLFIYFGHVKTAEAKERAHQEQIVRQKREADEKKKVAEAKAREDAKKRQDERDAEEKKKEEDKAAKQAADDKKVRDETAKYVGRLEAAQKQINDLEAELKSLRADKDRTSRETFEMAKQVELARIARRNAELEIQRMTEMVSRRAADSSLTTPPPVAAVPPTKG